IAHRRETDAEQCANGDLRISRREPGIRTIAFGFIHVDYKLHLVTRFLETAEHHVAVSCRTSSHEEGLRVPGPAGNFQHLADVMKHLLRSGAGKMEIHQSVMDAKQLLCFIDSQADLPCAPEGGADLVAA